MEWHKLVGCAIGLMAAAPGLAACKVDKVIDLPVTLQGMQPLTAVTMNGHPVRLMVDSGAFFSLITPGSAAELALPLEPAPTGFFVSGAGGMVQPSVGTVRDFTVGPVTLHRIQFLVGGGEIGSAGVIGQNLLHFRDVEYDLAAGMVRLMDSHDCAHANLAYWAKPDQGVVTLPLTTTDGRGRTTQHTVGTVTVNGIAMRALFDTGAGATSLTTTAAARAGVHVGDAGVSPAPPARGIGRRLVRSWVGTFGTIRIGDEEIRNTRLRIEQEDDASYDMVIGADFFLSHHVYVANTLHRMFVTYNGGNVFRLRDMPVASDGPLATAAAVTGADPADEPTDADGFARRGAARLARRDPAAALADLTEAVKRAPGRPDLLQERARIHMVLDQPLLAGGDLDAVLKLDPDEVDAHLMRAVLRLRANDHDGARDDADAVDRLAPKPADLRLELGDIYEALDLFDPAIQQDTLWIAAHPDDARRAQALNSRCWIRALAKKDLSDALADCDGAVRRQPDNASFLDSRALVRLRMGDYAKAVTDYDKALGIAPRMAFSIYCRGLAKLGSGDMANGRADLAAAAAINGNVARKARRYGLVPPG